MPKLVTAAAVYASRGWRSRATKPAGLRRACRENQFALQSEAGGLMRYGPNVIDLFRRAAWYVDQILSGGQRCPMGSGWS